MVSQLDLKRRDKPGPEWLSSSCIGATADCRREDSAGEELRWLRTAAPFPRIGSAGTFQFVERICVPDDRLTAEAFQRLTNRDIRSTLL